MGTWSVGIFADDDAQDAGIPTARSLIRDWTELRPRTNS